jgi:replicative superfamily II helicase
MSDALNAEISLGTVSNINDAVQWLGYTYLFVRAKKNPMAYGVTFLVFRFLLKSHSMPFRDALERRCG